MNVLPLCPLSISNCIYSHDYTDSPPDSPEVMVVMDSFKSKIIKVRVSIDMVRGEG